MEDMNVTKALLKAILELIEKCDTLGLERASRKSWRNKKRRPATVQSN